MRGAPFARGLTVRAEAGGDSAARARLLDDSPWPPTHNTPFPLKRSPPVSFKRLLDGGFLQLAPTSGRRPLRKRGTPARRAQIRAAAAAETRESRSRSRPHQTTHHAAKAAGSESAR